MSLPTTPTDFDKHGSFKITSSTVKRSSNESHSHDDESKKQRLEKSANSSSILATSSSAAIHSGNSVIIGSTGDSVAAKRVKTRKIISDGSTSQQYQLIVEDSAGDLSEESSVGGGDTSSRTFPTAGEEMVLVRKQISTKIGDSSDVVEGDPGGTAGTAYLTTMSTKSVPKRLQLGMTDAKKSLGDSIDLKLITASGETVSAGKFSMLSTGDKKFEQQQQILLTASSSSINPQNTFTYSRVCSVGNITGSGESLNLKSIPGAVKNQSLVVSSKKLMPEVTQTTAKVSIGNTTISVPLLKPLNSTQIIQPGGAATSQSGSSEGTKSVIHTIQTSSNQSPQTQLSKILNIKRGQKVSQPTFVSLSQLQIKPVSSQKIVQAKVLSKKIPLHIQAVQGNKSTLLQQNSGLVTITSTKPDMHSQQIQPTLQGHILPSPHKKQNISSTKDLPVAAVIKTTSSSNSDELNASSSQTPSCPSSTSEQSNSVPGTSMLNSEKLQIAKSAAASGAANSDSISSSLIATDFLPAGVKVVHTASASHLNNTSMRPSLATQLDTIDQIQNPQTSQTQTQRINICPTISIVRQNSPQLVTTSGNMSTVSLSMSDTVCGQQKLVLTKSQFANVSAANTSGSNNFPRNISLMLAKNSAGQQIFTNAGNKSTLCVTTSANTSVSKSNVTGRMNLNINPNSTSIASSSSILMTKSTTGESDSGAVVAEGQNTMQDKSLQMQPPTQQANIVHNRKIIQVLPGGLYSSGGSFVQLKQSKTDLEDEKKKVVEVEPQSTQHVQQQQHQHIHLQIQQSQATHQAGQHQQQHQIHLQLQQQQQQQQPHQHIQIQQIQTQIPQQQQQQLQRQQLLQQRQHMIHKQLQLQKQQHLLQQQQQQPSQPQEAVTSGESSQVPSSFSTPMTTTVAATDQQQHHVSTASVPPSKSEESNNVLLKQLLQNSSSTPINNQSSAQCSRINSVSASTSAALPSRKVINVRAPSLGLVSSLEAQLARPVIPPVPASESTTQPTAASISTHAPTLTSAQATTPTSTTTSQALKTTSQSLKMTIENTKTVSTLHSSQSPTPMPIHSLVTNMSTPTSVSSSSAVNIPTSKALSSVSNADKPKFPSSPLISKETSFVSKPTMSEQSEQNIEIFSLQSPSGDCASKTEMQQQFEQLTSTSSGQPQISNPKFKSFTAAHSTANQIGPSTTTKITKFVQDVKKATDQQQQQQHLSITRTFNNSGGGTNVLGVAKDKNSGIITTQHNNPPQAAVVNVNQQQQFMTGGIQQHQNKAFSTSNDGNLQDGNSQTKAVDGKCLSAGQLMHISASKQVHIQLHQDSTQSGAANVKLEADDNTIHNVQLQHQSQMHQQQQPFRSHSNAPSSISTTPTNSVPSTPTADCQTPMHVITKHTPQQQQTPLSTANTSQSTTPAPSTGSKDGDQRKKRKRDQTKQCKKLTSNTKEIAVNSATAPFCAASGVSNKKRSRKSLKLEEDYDSFIDNLMLHLRQMPPMQVLEPRLNINYGVCNLYGWRNWTRSTNSTSNSPPKESRISERANLFEQELAGEYGCGYLPNKVPFYDLDAFEDQKSTDECSASSSMQNNYYDQEFKSFTYKSEPEKLTSWVKVYRERSVDTPEVVSNKQLIPIDPVKTMRLNMLQQETFPGLILMSNTQQKLGRMSPVIPIVNSMSLVTKRKKTPLKPLDNEAVHQEMYIKEYPDDMDCKLGVKSNGNSQNVILSLPTSSAERLLDVLKNLANLLQINAPIPYKVVGDSDSEREHKSPIDMSDSDRDMFLKYLSIQDILNGRSKMCRNCGKAIKGRCLKSNSDNNKTPIHAQLPRPTPPTYYCNKICYLQFRLSIEKKQQGTASLKSVLAYKDGLQSEDNLVDELLDVKPDITMLLDDPKANATAEEIPSEPVSKAKKVCFRYYNSKCFQPSTPVKRMSEKEIRDLLFRMDITISATASQNNPCEPNGLPLQPIEDRRTCVLCSHIGDGVADGPSRLLNYDVDKWVHLNCALWSTDVYETISGGLMNFQTALQMGLNQTCNTCQKLGATVKCYKTRCGAVFHLPCAIRDQCVFYQNKTIHCHAHASRIDKDKELLSLSVPRRVYVERDENRQVAAIMHHSEMMHLLRVGSLIFLNVGQLLPHQLEAFHTPNFIYPIGYKMIRFYWSMRRPNKRCRYICSIAEVSGRPEFRIVVQEPAEADVEFRDISPKAVWLRVLQSVADMRKSHKLVKLYPEFISGEDLFGLTEPTIVRIIESLPGVETLTNYRFKYGRNPLLDLPLALNPSGAARTEPKLRQLMGWKKHHPQRTCSTVSSMGGGGHLGVMPSVTAAGEVTCPYSKQFVHSKSSQYKKMKQEWRNNVYLARSKIQGLGLYAARDLEKHTMIIEYIGEVIRTEVSEIREKQYEAKNRGIYMFRLDEDRVVDATLSGGLARYINHSCNPNCVTEIVEVDRELRIIIFAKRRINRGEELSYDYKFDIEDDGSKIPCMCGAPNCRKWMN